MTVRLLPLEPAHRSDPPWRLRRGLWSLGGVRRCRPTAFNVLSDLTYAIVVAAGHLSVTTAPVGRPTEASAARDDIQTGREALCRSQPLSG